MSISKIFTLFVICYIVANVSWWGWQEHIHYEDTQNMRALDNTINIEASIITEKEQDLEKAKINLAKEKETLDELLSSKKIAQYNEVVPKYNKSVDEFNQQRQEYDEMIKTHNSNIRQFNSLVTKSGTRTFIFPIPPYTQPLIAELK
jgi:hypothetical protein